MYKILDLLFGYRDIGWLKTALISSLLGFGVLYVFGIDIFEMYEESGKFLFIFIGLPIWWFLRQTYWNFRINQVAKLKNQKLSKLSKEEKLRLEKDLASIEKNNPRLFSAVFGIGRYY